MLLINLKGSETGRRWVPALFLLVLTLAILVFRFPFEIEKKGELRPLAPEERTIVNSALNRVRYKLPELNKWVEEFSQQMDSGTVNCFTTSIARSKDVAWEDRKSIIFSVPFFLADSTVQENSLVQVMIELRSAIALSHSPSNGSAE